MFVFNDGKMFYDLVKQQKTTKNWVKIACVDFSRCLLDST